MTETGRVWRSLMMITFSAGRTRANCIGPGSLIVAQVVGTMFRPPSSNRYQPVLALTSPSPHLTGLRKRAGPSEHQKPPEPSIRAGVDEIQTWFGQLDRYSRSLPVGRGPEAKPVSYSLSQRSSTTRFVLPVASPPTSPFFSPDLHHPRLLTPDPAL